MGVTRVRLSLRALQAMDLMGLQFIACLFVMVLVVPFVLGGINPARHAEKEELLSDLDA